MNPVAHVDFAPSSSALGRSAIVGMALIGCEAGAIALHIAFPDVFLARYCFLSLYACVAIGALLMDRVWLSYANTVVVGTLAFLFVDPAQQEVGVEPWPDKLGLTIFIGGGWLFTLLADRLRGATRQSPQQGRGVPGQQAAVEGSQLPLKQMAALLEVAEDAIVITDDRGQIAYWNRGAEKTYGWQEQDAVGQVFGDLVPTEFPVARPEVTAAIRDLGIWEGELTQVRKDGRRIVVSSRTVRAREGGRSDLLSVSRDITSTKDAQVAMASAKDQLAREVDERTHDLQRTAQALQAEVVGRSDAERAMRANRDTVHAILETAAQGILVADQHGIIQLANPAMAAIFGYDRTQVVGQPLDILLPERLRQRHAAHVETWWKAPTSRRVGGDVALIGRRRDGSEVPLEISLSYVDGSDGRLAVGFFSDITERLRADAALRTSEQELRDLSARLLTVVEDERRRIARELHDDVVQQLGLCAWEVDRLTVRVRPSTPDTTDGLRALKDRVSRVLVDVRRLSHGLHPAALQVLGLEEALWAFCESVTQAHGPSIVFSGSLPSDALDDPTKFGLYHIAQEAIANAVAHADASEIRVDLRSVPDGVRLTIQDNGLGFTPDPSRPRGLGLVSMAERARLARGTMTIEGRPGGGTVVRVSVPRRGPI